MNRKKYTGRELYLYIFQTVSLLPLLYMLLFTGMFSIITNHNLFGFLFDLGLVCLPKIEFWILSRLYHETLNEILVFFLMPCIALILGRMINRKFSEKDGNSLNTILVFLLLIDLILRLLPLAINTSFPVCLQIIGFAVRSWLLTMILKDQIKDGNLSLRLNDRVILSCDTHLFTGKKDLD